MKKNLTPLRGLMKGEIKMETFKVEISERLKERRFSELDLRIKYNSDTKEIVISGKENKLKITYKDVSTKEDVIECLADYLNDYLTNP